MGVNSRVYKVKSLLDQRRHDRARRLPLRAQAVLHQPGNVHAAALARVRHRHPDRRHRQPARRRARLDLRRDGRSVPDATSRTTCPRHDRHSARRSAPADRPAHPGHARAPSAAPPGSRARSTASSSSSSSSSSRMGSTGAGSRSGSISTCSRSTRRRRSGGRRPT